MKTAVIYARFSCSKQREASIKDQVRVCTEWCAREGYMLKGCYCDEAVSGRTDDRPEFQRMIANAGESDIVLVYMMDRFSRDIYDAPIYKKALRDKGVKVVSATESLPDGPEAMLMENIYEAMAALESEKIGRRTKRGMEGNALKCLWNGVRVYGYDHDEEGRYIINEDQASVVRECFMRRIGGEAINSIASDLALRGVTSYAGNPVGHTFVDNLLRNEKYKGIYMWGDVRVEGGMPRIVEDIVYDQAQVAKVKKRRKAEHWSEFAFAGKAVCGSCFHNIVGASGRGRGNVKYEYYRCGNNCGCKPVRADWLESAVVAAVRSVLNNRDSALEVARAVSSYFDRLDTGKQLKAARKRRDEAQKGVRNILDAVGQGLSMNLAQPKIDEYEMQLGVAVAEITMLENASKFDYDDFADFLQFGATLDDKAVLDAFVWQVMMDDENVTVTLNYDLQGEPARVTFPNGSQNSVSAHAFLPEKGQKETSNQVTEEVSLVRRNTVWLPRYNTKRTVEVILADARCILLRFKRAA